MPKVSTVFKARQALKRLFGQNQVLSGQNEHYGNLMHTHGDDHPEYGGWYNSIIQNNKRIRDNQSAIAELRGKHRI
jgi:hypothetical protein